MAVDWSASDLVSPCAGAGGTDYYSHATRWSGLSLITPTTDLVLAPISSAHDNVYYVAPGVNEKAQKAGKAYRAATYGQNPLIVTAASLIYGGLNDIGNNWSTPHKAHRIGTDVDFVGLYGQAGHNPRIFALIQAAGMVAGFISPCPPHPFPDSVERDTHVHCSTVQY